MSKAKELLCRMVTEMVDHPNKVIVNEIILTKTILLSIKVHQDDTGKVIGKNGRNIKALDIIISNSIRKRGFSTHITVKE